MFTGWLDQKRDLAALRSHLGAGTPTRSRTTMGPAYIASGAGPRAPPAEPRGLAGPAQQGQLRAVGGAGCRARAGAAPAADRRAADGPIVQFAFVGIVFAAGTWHWSDAPWSHFFAAFLAVAVYAARFAPVRLTTASAPSAGVALALLSLTRSLEFVACSAWGIALAGLAALRDGARTLRMGTSCPAWLPSR